MVSTNESNFAKFILSEMPLPVAIANSKVEVEAINIAAQNFFCLSSDEAHLRRCGEVLKCIHASQPEGCGGTPACKNCVLRNSVLRSLQGKAISRNKGFFHVFENNEIKRLTLLITTAPTYYQSNPMVIILIEDISLITELQGLLPICSVCHKIRAKGGEWSPLEDYIKKHSEVEFTHDYCPECIQKMSYRKE